MAGKSYVGQAPTDAVLSANDLATGCVSTAKIATGAVTYDKNTYLTGQVIQAVYSEYLTNADMTTVLPEDDTIPQITEGTEILTAAITPKFATSKIRVRFQGLIARNTAASIIAALFVDATAAALAANVAWASTAGGGEVVTIEYQESAASVTARTYRLRVGPGSAGTVRVNGTTSNRLFGGVMRTTLVVEEVAV